MNQAIAIVVSGLLTGIGFFFRRWIGRERLGEVIERRLKLDSTHAKMKSAGIDQADLDRLEAELLKNETLRGADGLGEPDVDAPIHR